MIAVEHEPVITLGAKTDPENLLVKPDVLAGQGIEVFQTDRGGDITYHGPGQLVVYPILNLRKVGCDVHQYLRIVEESVMRTLAYYGFESHIRHPAAVWVGERKICSFGIAVRGMVTYHGLALNVAPDMKHFAFINPCGLSSFQMTSLKILLGESPSFAQVKQLVVDNLVQLLRLNLISSGGVSLP